MLESQIYPTIRRAEQFLVAIGVTDGQTSALGLSFYVASDPKRSPVASAEFDQASPSTSSARTAACPSSSGCASTATSRALGRREREAAGAGVDAGDLGKRLAQAADLDAQPRAMRFVGIPGAEGASQ